MSLGDWFVVIFVGLIFCLGILGGIKLFKWNMKDHEKMMDKNKALKNKEDVRKRNDGETSGHAGPDGRN